MVLSPSNNWIREIFHLTPIFQDNNCFRIRYLEITFTFYMYFGTSWIDATGAQESKESLTGWWKVVLGIFGMNKSIWEIFATWRGRLTKKRYFVSFWKAGSDWPLSKVSTLSVIISCFLSIHTTFFTNTWRKYFPLNVWAVFHLSHADSLGFDQNWAKSRPLFFYYRNPFNYRNLLIKN